MSEFEGRECEVTQFRQQEGQSCTLLMSLELSGYLPANRATMLHEFEPRHKHASFCFRAVTASCRALPAIRSSALLIALPVPRKSPSSSSDSLALVVRFDDT